jgi:hypothetical protein
MIHSFLRAVDAPEEAFMHTRQDVLRSTALMEKFHKGKCTEMDM